MNTSTNTPLPDGVTASTEVNAILDEIDHFVAVALADAVERLTTLRPLEPKTSAVVDTKLASYHGELARLRTQARDRAART